MFWDRASPPYISVARPTAASLSGQLWTRRRRIRVTAGPGGRRGDGGIVGRCGRRGPALAGVRPFAVGTATRRGRAPRPARPDRRRASVVPAWPAPRAVARAGRPVPRRSPAARGVSVGAPTKRPSSRSRGDRPSTPRRWLADRQPNAPRRPPAGSSSPWIARARPASVRLRTIRARSTRLIWPFSSDTTMTIASVCSVMPRAARWRVPKRSVWIDVSASGRSAPAATIRSSRMITAPSWSGDFGREDRAQQVGRHVAVDHDAGLGHLLEARSRARAR